MQLSKLEHRTFEKIKKNGLVVFTTRDISLLLDFKKEKIYNIIKSLKKKGAIISVGKRKFSTHDTNEFEIASNIVFPSYISFWSALNYYGFSDNTPKKIFIATPSNYNGKENFKFVTISKRKFFGYTSIGNMIIAEKEKAIIDSLMFPKYSGGIKEIKKSLESSLEKIDKKKLIEYALKINSRCVIRRLGYMLDILGVKDLKKLKSNIGKGFEKLDPSLKKKNKLNKDWLLDINT